MCIDGNSAPASVRYLNAQLAASWQNAHDCAAHYRHGTTVELDSDAYIRTKYMRSLAEFHYAGDHPPGGPVSKEDLFFSATFNQPHLQFVCNHDVILHLNIEGHLNKNVAKAKSSDPRANRAEKVTFGPTSVAIRMNFDRRAIHSEDPLIGNGGNIIQLMVLDFNSSKVLTNPEHVHHDVFTFYIRKYLQHLRNAGHHVLFDLPDFDNDRFRTNIDYSLAITSSEINLYCDTEIHIHGVHPHTIEERLRKLWLNAVVSARGLAGPTVTVDRLSNCLLEIQSIWLPDIQSYFHIDFSPPTIRSLCPHEAVLIFELNKVDFFETPDFDLSPVETFSNWKIACVVNTTKAHNEKGTHVGFNFDFTNVRFCPHLSTIFEEGDIACGFFDTIVEFIFNEYIGLLISYKFYEFHLLELPIIDIPDDPEGPICSPEFEDPRGPLRRPMFGFDQIISVSEESINQTFATLWRHAGDTKVKTDDLLVCWKTDDGFHADFDALKVELLSDNKAIVRVNFRKGRMSIKGHEEPVGFNSWTLAFLVDIKMIEIVERGALAEIFWDRFHRSPIGIYHDKVVKHLILDFRNAHFLLDHSSLGGLWAAGVLSAVERLRTVVRHTNDYLHQVAYHGHHIVYSVPLIETVADSNGPFALTSVAFQVVSYTHRTLFNVRRVRVAPVVLITGMVKHNRLPRTTLTWHSAWIIHKSHGTIALSREAFLDGRLLPLLATVNAKTTVLPRFPNPDEDEFSIHLTTLENHPYRRHKKFDWRLVDKSREGFLDYEYSHRDEWSYEHSGSFPEVGAYSVVCATKNTMGIPITYRPGLLEIEIKGESSLRVKGKDQHKDWSQETRAHWTTIIRAHSEWNGLRIDISSSAPEYANTVKNGGWTVDAGALLANHLPKSIDTTDVIHHLKHVLEGTWEYAFPGLLSYDFANPVFTVDGDLIVQLRIHDPHHKPSLHTLQTSRSFIKNGIYSPVTPNRARAYIPLSPSPSARSSHSFGLSPTGGTNGSYYGNGNHIAQNGNGVDGLKLRTPVMYDRKLDGYSPGPESPLALFSE